NSSGTCGPDIMSFLLLHPEVYDARDHTSPILQELPVILREVPMRCARRLASRRAGRPKDPRLVVRPKLRILRRLRMTLTQEGGQEFEAFSTFRQRSRGSYAVGSAAMRPPQP